MTRLLFYLEKFFLNETIWEVWGEDYSLKKLPKWETLTETLPVLLCRKVPSATQQPPADTDSMAAIFWDL